MHLQIKALPGNNHFPGACCSSKKKGEAYSCVISVTSYPASVITWRSLASSTFSGAVKVVVPASWESEKATIDSLIELVETLKRSEEKWN